KRTFRPEFLNRIDETIVFHSLEKKHMKDIVSLMIKEVQSRMETQEMNFTITDGAIEKIAEEGFDPEYGARPLRRSIQTNIEDRKSTRLNSSHVSISYAVFCLKKINYSNGHTDHLCQSS